MSDMLTSIPVYTVCKCSLLYISSIDKQRIFVNMQLKSSKKQLNACMPKSNLPVGMQLHAMSLCNLVHFVSISVIHKCQSGIDFFTSVRG